MHVLLTCGGAALELVCTQYQTVPDRLTSLSGLLPKSALGISVALTLVSSIQASSLVACIVWLVLGRGGKSSS